MIFKKLEQVFGYKQFRPLQEDIIRRTISGKDSLVLMPTGGGKSICFQIPALCLEGITIVVSPLISLMKDQVQALQSNGVKASFFNSSLSPFEVNEVIQNALNGQTKILYLSPEKLIAVKDTWLKQLSVSLVAIDEAHCVSMWGHDFRKEYTQLNSFRKSLAHVPFIALTATADKSTRVDIIEQLGLENSELFISSFDRKNIQIDVRGNVSKKDKLKQIVNFINSKPKESGIIYCLSRKNTEELSAYLNSSGIESHCYHAGMDGALRAKVQTDFINDTSKIIVATIAFGMGIDKSNVRWVIHSNLPKNLEGYYQEIGRAGRDGLPSETLLYYSMRDVVLYRQFAADSANAEMQIDKLNRMLQFSQAKSCRRKILLSYFGEFLADNCNNCDACSNPPQIFDATVIAQKALSVTARMQESEPVVMAVNVLRGSQNAKVFDKEYHKLKTYGIGKDISYYDWNDYFVQLTNLGALEIAYNESSALKITPFGWSILKDRVKIDLSKPIPENEKKVKKTKSKKEPKQKVNKALFEELRALRTRLAKAENVPPYIIFSDKSLSDMVALKPDTASKFMDVSGVGQNKLEKYGNQFMTLIKEFKSENADSKTPTKLVSYNSYKEGVTIEDIATERKLKPSTILIHLVDCYLEGLEIDLAVFVTEDIVLKVANAYKECEQPITMKPIFDFLEEEIQYNDIRVALAILKYNKQI
ncbi:MAG: DNA helicase RecQ [Flavobacteriales bacterium]|jgi:ATP-dependent DNA helicase RecQ|tara:strand:- start:290 stop:2398 length:2109 start_codon:yes stop_codon:yes gene_type:complete